MAEAIATPTFDEVLKNAATQDDGSDSNRNEDVSDIQSFLGEEASKHSSEPDEKAEGKEEEKDKPEEEDGGKELDEDENYADPFENLILGNRQFKDYADFEKHYNKTQGDISRYIGENKKITERARELERQVEMLKLVTDGRQPAAAAPSLKPETPATTLTPQEQALASTLEKLGYTKNGSGDTESAKEIAELKKTIEELKGGVASVQNMNEQQQSLEAGRVAQEMREEHPDFDLYVAEMSAYLMMAPAMQSTNPELYGTLMAGKSIKEMYQSAYEYAKAIAGNKTPASGKIRPNYKKAIDGKSPNPKQLLNKKTINPQRRAGPTIIKTSDEDLKTEFDILQSF